MAIKPTDCVVYLDSLITGYTKVNANNYLFLDTSLPIYVPYWNNFLDHVSEVYDFARYKYDFDYYLNQELEKYNAVYRKTKSWKNRHIKFRSHRDYTMFVLKWS